MPVRIFRATEDVFVIINCDRYTMHYTSEVGGLVFCFHTPSGFDTTYFPMAKDVGRSLVAHMAESVRVDTPVLLQMPHGAFDPTAFDAVCVQPNSLEVFLGGRGWKKKHMQMCSVLCRGAWHRLLVKQLNTLYAK